MLTEGKKAPNFKLSTDEGTPLSLSSLKGQAAVIYFYPKDDTSGCTLEAKDFSALADKFKEAGAVIVGISPDSVASHHKFKKKHSLNVVLVADEEKSAAEAYGVWVEKSMYGRKYMGVERATFLVNAKGQLARIWRKVKVRGHAEEVLEAVRSLPN